MGCKLESAVITGENPQDIQVIESACPPECTGVITETESRRLILGRFGPLVERTVMVCPITGNRVQTPLLYDLIQPVAAE